MRLTSRTLTFALICLALAGAAGAQDESQIANLTKQKQAVAEIREIGMAFIGWLADQVSTDDPADISAIARLDGWTVRRDSEEPNTYLRISHAALSELLVPVYLDSLPSTDPWGGSYEYSLNENLLGNQVLAIRSPGGDGVFETDDYVSGSFPSQEGGHDIVWCDGYFARWPG